MKENKEILESVFEPNGFTIQRALGLREDHDLIADPGYKRILFAMEKSQREILNQVLNEWHIECEFGKGDKSIEELINEKLKQL